MSVHPLEVLIVFIVSQTNISKSASHPSYLQLYIVQGGGILLGDDEKCEAARGADCAGSSACEEDVRASNSPESHTTILLQSDSITRYDLVGNACRIWLTVS